jgi:DNA repair protein RecN (Recombination protein N)
MLKSLSIRNYALIEKIDMDFFSGFSVITGETGAGKSILLGALGLILGNRADNSVIRDPERKCIVEGVFDLGQMDLTNFFKENNLDYDSETILRREINASGKSRAFINDSPVNLNLLKELGEQLVNIHSQYQTLNLGKFEFQLNTLDAFINEPELTEAYRQAYNLYKAAEKRFLELEAKNQQLRTDEDYLRFQLSEFQTVKLDRETFENLVDRERLLTHSEEIASGIMLCQEWLSDADTNVTQMLAEVSSTLKKLAAYHPSLQTLADRLDAVEIEMSDISTEIAGLGNDIEYDPGELEEIKQQLDKYYHLQQKHHVQTIDELISLQEEMSARLNSIENIDEDTEKAASELEELRKKVTQLAEKLHKKRSDHAPELAGKVSSILQQLGMKNARFVVDVIKTDELWSAGMDKVEFLFNANKGGTPEQIAKVASGGELSRLMLAIKSLIHQRKVLPTVIFDEIDTGVSGDIAGKVGNILKEMADNHQVLVITHLPQIASKADHHYHVYKTEDTLSASTNIELLDNDGRVEAIARMLSDERITETSVKAARELLN